MIDATLILPTRSDEDILAGVVRLRLGRQSWVLPALPIKANREVKAMLLARGFELIALMDPETELSALLKRLAQGTDDQLDCLAAYDLSGVLPSREWIENHATEDELWAATKVVMAAAFPFVDGLRQMVPTVMELIRTLQGGFTSISRRRTGGLLAWWRRN